MRNEYLAAFIDRLPQMDDTSVLRTLVQMAASSSQYDPEAIAAVRNEVVRRGLTAAQASEAVTRAKQDALDALEGYATDLALQGHSVDRIQTQLKARGVGEATAEAMAKRACDMPIEGLKRAGRRNMITGATIGLVGLLITGVTYYTAATNPEGGRYVIAVGAVVVGFLQFLRGARQYPNSRIPPEPK